MSIPLHQVLELVGRLDDTPGDDTGRERFRRYLTKNVTTAAQTRDHIEECLRNAGEQSSRALQDLTNHLGRFLGFEIDFGRYQGVRGKIGYDGLWQSPQGFHIVAEVKTSEIYPIKPATIVSYVDELISDKRIPNWDKALGLYVIGHPDPEIRQLENAIIAEKRTHQLRIVSINSLLTLAEIMGVYDVSHDDVLAVLWPSGPRIDPLVELLARVVTESVPFDGPSDPPVVDPPVVDPSVPDPPSDSAVYWLTPVKSDEEETADVCIQRLVGEAKIYAFGERTPGRRHMKIDDRICFYATGKGVVAHARIATAPVQKPDARVRQAEKYPWTVRLNDTSLYLGEPVVIDADLRSQLDAFSGRDPAKATWAWFVQATRRISEHDFALLTRH